MGNTSSTQNDGSAQSNDTLIPETTSDTDKQPVEPPRANFVEIIVTKDLIEALKNDTPGQHPPPRSSHAPIPSYPFYPYTFPDSDDTPVTTSDSHTSSDDGYYPSRPSSVSPSPSLPSPTPQREGLDPDTAREIKEMFDSERSEAEGLRSDIASISSSITPRGALPRAPQKCNESLEQLLQCMKTNELQECAVPLQAWKNCVNQ
eukprot:TRINITY_DN4250_c0_g1_i2.p1 TRINITY_DN4250_c0_g1~~TRINITY_DN4250_c0_g1_i2.p1  ORF type:complete len:211 (-),score=19.58 TRINITY_DN4250_c0_g1_i2:52-663(-)